MPFLADRAFTGKGIFIIGLLQIIKLEAVLVIKLNDYNAVKDHKNDKALR